MGTFQYEHHSYKKKRAHYTKCSKPSKTLLSNFYPILLSTQCHELNCWNSTLVYTLIVYYDSVTVRFCHCVHNAKRTGFKGELDCTMFVALCSDRSLMLLTATLGMPPFFSTNLIALKKFKRSLLNYFHHKNKSEICQHLYLIKMKSI